MSMGIKEKLAAIAVAKVTELASSEAMDGAINTVLNKIGKASGTATIDEHIQKVQNNYLVIKARSFSVGTIVGLFSGDGLVSDDLGRYQVETSDGRLKYAVKAKITATDRDILDLYDENSRKLGHIKEHLLPMGVPVFEKDVKKCTVFWGKEKLCVLKKYKSFGEKHIDVVEGKAKVSCKGKEIKISCYGRDIALLHEVTVNLRDGYVDRFVMEPYSKEDEALGVLFATAIDLLGSHNLY